MENKVESFQPMPKRFMVWDKKQENFIVPENCDTRKWLYIEELAIFMHQLGIGGFGDETRSRYIIVQSTNLFDKDGKEIFEGSIVINDYLSYPDHKKGKTIQAAPKVLTWDPKTARFVLNANPIMDLASRGGNSGKNLTVIGHILSNPELMEKEDV